LRLSSVNGAALSSQNGVQYSFDGFADGIEIDPYLGVASP